MIIIDGYYLKTINNFYTWAFHTDKEVIYNVFVIYELYLYDKYDTCKLWTCFKKSLDRSVYNYSSNYIKISNHPAWLKISRGFIIIIFRHSFHCKNKTKTIVRWFVFADNHGCADEFHLSLNEYFLDSKKWFDKNNYSQFITITQNGIYFANNQNPQRTSNFSTSKQRMLYIALNFIG